MKQQNNRNKKMKIKKQEGEKWRNAEKTQEVPEGNS